MPDSPAPPPLPGDRVGPYLLVRPLGVGGSATVYEAQGPQGEALAVKILHPGRARSPEERLFRREVQVLQSIDHPGVVRVLGAGREGAYPWMAMELVDGTDLGGLLERWKESPPADRPSRVEAIFRGLCEALSAVHAHGVIHRDLKPSNVLVTRDGQVKLADFGVVGTAGALADQDETLVGTLAFMAPERILGRPVDSRSDLYALGAVLYTLLTGQLPLEADTREAWLERQVSERPRPPSELDPRVPPRLERVCLRLLEKDPAARYASARQALAALDQPERSAVALLRGREAAFARLMGHLDRLAEGEGGVVAVSGPPGSGKSSLLDELASRGRARGQDLAVCSGEREDPIGLLCEQLPELGDSLRPRGDASARLVGRARGRPWALLVDDLDRLLPEALSAVTTLVRERVAVEGDPLLFVVSVSDPQGSVASFCSGEFTGMKADVIALRPLAEADVVGMARDLGMPGACARVIGRRLAHAGVVWPAVVLERIGAMEAAGWLVRAESGALLPAHGLDWIEEQSVFEPVSSARPGASDSEAGPLELALTLAALGGEAPLPLLEEILGGGLGPDIAALEARGLLLGRGEDEEAADSDEDPARRSLQLSAAGLALLQGWPQDPGSRRARHAAVAEALQRWAPRTGLWVPLLADQLQRAGQTARAWPLLVEAAEMRLRQRRHAESWRWLRRAVEARGAAEPGTPAAVRAATRQRLYATEGALWEEQGDQAQAAESWRRAGLAAEEREDDRGLALARCGQGRALSAMGAHEDALEVLRRGLPPLGRGDAVWLPSTCAMARSAAATGDLRLAARCWQAALDHARAAALTLELSRLQAELDALTPSPADTAPADR